VDIALPDIAPTPIERSPFWQLNVTPRESAQRILAALDEMNISVGDPKLCSQLRTALTLPRNRISTEVAWLPGVSPAKAQSAVSSLRQDPFSLLERSDMPPLALANLWSSALLFLMNDHVVDDISRWFCKLAKACDDINVDEVLVDINEDRIVAKFAQIASPNLIHEEILNRRKEFKSSMLAVLNCLSSDKLIEVMTLSIERATGFGSRPSPVLLDELVESYQFEATKFFQIESTNISKLIEHARSFCKEKENGLAELIGLIGDRSRTWRQVAYPVQVSMKSRALDHDQSRVLAVKIRDLSVDLVNDHGRLDEAQGLLNILQKEFADLPNFAVRLDEDSRTLSDLSRQRDELAKSDEEWKSAISFNCTIGGLMRGVLSMSYEGISWKNQFFALNAVSRVRWGATRHSVNGIPTGTTYHVKFGDVHNLAAMDTRDEAVFTSFTEKLWRAVGVRLLIELVGQLKAGSKVKFGDAVIGDDGVEMPRRRFFGSGEVIHVNWDRVKVWNSAGCFCLGSADDRKVNSTLSYQDVDNVHVLEALIRMFFKSGCRRPSDALQ